MLSVYDLDYYKRKFKQEPIKNNEKWFMEHIDQIKMDDTAKKLASDIDGVEFISDTHFKNIAGDVTPLRYLSTSAKAALNVYFFPMKVFDFTNCRDKAVAIAHMIPKGRMTLTMHNKHSSYGYPDEEYDYPGRIRVVTDYGIQVCSSVFQSYHYLTWSITQNLYNYDYKFAVERGAYRHAIGLRGLPFGTNMITFDEFVSAAMMRHWEMEQEWDYYNFDKPHYPGYSGGQGYTAWSDIYDDMPEEVSKRYDRKLNYELTREKVLRKKYLHECTRRNRVREGFSGTTKSGFNTRCSTLDILSWLSQIVRDECDKCYSEDAGTTYIQIGLENAHIRKSYGFEDNIEIVFKLNHQMIDEKFQIIQKELEEGKVRENWNIAPYYKKEDQAREIIRDVYLKFLGKLLEGLQLTFKKTVAIKEIKDTNTPDNKETPDNDIMEFVSPEPTIDRSKESSENKALDMEEQEQSEKKKPRTKKEKARAKKEQARARKKVTESEIESGIIWI